MQAFLAQTGCGDLGATSPDGRFTVIEVECLWRVRFRHAVLINDDFDRERDARARAGAAGALVRLMGYPHPIHPQETPLLSKHFGEAEARTLRRLGEARRVRRA